MKKKDYFYKLLDYPSLYWRSRLLYSWLKSLFSPSFGDNGVNENNKFLFIVGSGRSGNTLLRRLIMERLDVFIPPETYVLQKIADYRVTARGLSWGSLVNLVVSTFEYHPGFETFNIADLSKFAIEAKNWNKEEQTIPKLIVGLYSWISEHAGISSSWLGDKSPTNTLNLGPISKILPNAKYIYIIRDGVDVSASYINSGIYQNIQDAGRRWVRSHKAWVNFKKRLSEKEYIEIQYESLVRESVDTIHKIKNKFNIPERNALSIIDFLGDVNILCHHANVLKPISTNSIGKGRNSLTKAQKNQLRPILNKILAQVGYNEL